MPPASRSSVGPVDLSPVCPSDTSSDQGARPAPPIRLGGLLQAPRRAVDGEESEPDSERCLDFPVHTHKRVIQPGGSTSLVPLIEDRRPSFSHCRAEGRCVIPTSVSESGYVLSRRQSSHLNYGSTTSGTRARRSSSPKVST